MSRVYSATYSNVPVYEYSVGGNHVMRRRADDWINATHILKVADYDKPARTRILEREVQKGVHEKVQGGYGKYQGTWIPLEEGRNLAERTGVLGKLLPMFDFVAGDRSPPPAPKHATAVSSKPKAARQSAAARRVAAVPAPAPEYVTEEQYHAMYRAVNATPDKASTETESDVDMLHGSQMSNSRKRKRGAVEAQVMSQADQEHLLWTDELLDYFMLSNTSEPLPRPPQPPPTIDLNRPIDEKGHTPMHWAAAMGDIQVVKDLISRGARIDVLATNGETPLVRGIVFTNNYDKRTMDKLINIMHQTAGLKDWFGSTVFHHISAATCSKSRYQCARYYLDTILTKLAEIYPQDQILALLDQQDQNGDTALLIAAKYGARKCARTLINHGASVDIPNHHGETADDLIKDLNARRRDRTQGGSSSPFVDPAHNRSSSGPLHTALLNGGRERSNTYRSEAATLIFQQLPTLISSRAEALASALENELAERDLEAADAERLLEQRKREIEHLQQQSLALAARDEDDAFDERQRAELDGLVRESERLLEVEQSVELARAVREEEAKVPPHMRTHSSSSTSNGGVGGMSIDTEKLHLAHALRSQQAARAVLVADIVAAQSLAGNGGSGINGVEHASAGAVAADAEGQLTQSSEQRHDLYKRLITGALGVRAEDVEALLPEMLRELEDARDDVAAAVGAPAGAGPTSGLVDGMMLGGTDGDSMNMHMQGIESSNGGGVMGPEPVRVMG